MNTAQYLPTYYIKTLLEDYKNELMHVRMNERKLISMITELQAEFDRRNAG